MNTRTKVLCYGSLLAIWGVFAWFGKTPVEGFITAVGAALTALGVVHAAATKNPASTPESTSAP